MNTNKMIKLCTILILLTLAACTAPQVQTPEPVATDAPPVNMPNPASVYCEQNGYELEIRTAPDGSQSGICTFLDGSTCDEWAYFWGKCGPAVPQTPAPILTVEATIDASGGYMEPGTSEPIADWWGVIKSNPPGAQYDDYFERQDLGSVINFGIDSVDPAIKSQIESQRDSGKIVHLYGTLISNVPDTNGSQILVDRIEVEP
jgi:putative hemolysin